MPKIPTIPRGGQLGRLKLPRPTPADFGGEGFTALSELGAAVKKADDEIRAVDEAVKGERILRQTAIQADAEFERLSAEADHETFPGAWAGSLQNLQTRAIEEAKTLGTAAQKALLPHIEGIVGSSQIRGNRKTRELKANFAIAEVKRALPDLARLATTAETPEERARYQGQARGLVRTLSPYLDAPRLVEMEQGFDKDLEHERVKYVSVGLQEKVDDLVNRALRDPERAGEHFTEGAQLIEESTGDWLPPEERQKARNKFKDQLWHSAVKGRIEADPVRALEDLKSGRLDKLLDQQSIVALRSEAEVKIHQLDQLAKAEKRERHASSKDALNDYATVIGMGLEPAMSVGQLQRQIGEFPDLVEKLSRVSRAAAIRQQTKAVDPVSLQNLIGDLRNRPQTAEGANLIKQLETDLGNMRSALDEDPLSYGSRALRMNLQPVNPSDPASLQLRARQARVVGERFGIPTSVFTRDEASAITRQLDAMPPAKRAKAYAVIGQNLPEEAGDATFSQFAKKGQTDSAVIADVARRDAEGAEMILLGRELRKDPKAFRGIFSSGAEKKLFEEIDSQVQSAYKNALVYTWSHIRQAIADAYLAQHARAGFDSEKMDRTKLEEAIRRVTGGLLNIRGQTIVPPKPGVRESQFMRMLEDESLWTNLGKGFSKGQILSRTDARFESVHSGRYIIRFGAAVVKDKTGEDFILDLRGIEAPTGPYSAILEGKVLSGMIK